MSCDWEFAHQSWKWNVCITCEMKSLLDYLQGYLNIITFLKKCSLDQYLALFIINTFKVRNVFFVLYTMFDILFKHL